LSGRTTTAPVEVIDADLSTVTAAADRVLRVAEDPPWLFHVELQSSRDPDLYYNLPAYNVLLERRHRLRVRSLLVLLRQTADDPELNGTVQRGFADEPPYLVLRYRVVRVWQVPVETFLGGGLGLLPLAPLSDVTEADLPAIIGRMEQRISSEAPPNEAGVLWTATDVLMGLRYDREFAQQLLRGVRGMKESVTYQAIVEEGVVQARQEALVWVGAKRFGKPSESVLQYIRKTTDPDRLERLVQALMDVGDWDELLRIP
jgi:hypothetical protein